jgi:hypothetical protein
LVEAPQPADLHLSIAHALKTLGRQREAIESYRSAAANLKTYAFTDAELKHMRAEEAKEDISLVDRFHLCFALGKALEDRGGYAESFEYY